jgi:hypothetical protein
MATVHSHPPLLPQSPQPPLPPDPHAALRIVLGTRELEQITELREENTELRLDRNLWKANVSLPECGKYYYIDSRIIEDHGYRPEKFVNCVFRYDGRHEQREISKYEEFLHHVDYKFTSPYKHCRHEMRRGLHGYIYLRLCTYELRHIWPIDFTLEGPFAYLSPNDEEMISTQPPDLPGGEWREVNSSSDGDNTTQSESGSDDSSAPSDGDSAHNSTDLS